MTKSIREKDNLYKKFREMMKPKKKSNLNVPFLALAHELVVNILLCQTFF